MTEDEIKSLIREYIVENLDIRVDVNRGGYSGPSVKVSLYFDDDLIANADDYLPEPKITY